MARSPAEIEDIIKRARHHKISEYEISRLESEFNKMNDATESFLDFIPIRLTTIIEHSIRGAVQDAVDHGEPYRSATILIIGKWSGKAIAEALLALSEERMTVGQFASFGIALGNLSEVMATLEFVFGSSFRSDFLTSKTKWIEPEKNDGKTIIVDQERTLATIARLIAVRHIVVHERPREAPYSRSEIPDFFEHSKQFVSALEWFVIGRLFGSVPYTQSQMNIEAGKRTTLVVNKLDELRGGTRDAFSSPKTKAEEIEFHWDQFCRLTADQYAGYHDEGWPGTIAPLLYAQALEAMTKWRIDQFERYGCRWNPGRKE